MAHPWLVGGHLPHRMATAVVSVHHAFRHFSDDGRAAHPHSSLGVASGHLRAHSSCVTIRFLRLRQFECRPSWCKPHPELMLEPAPEHIFVHQDLAPRNMILDDAGKLWVVDWGHAGFYPAYMEYMGLETTSMPWINAPTWAAW